MNMNWHFTKEIIINVFYTQKTYKVFFIFIKTLANLIIDCIVKDVGILGPYIDEGNNGKNSMKAK